MTVSPSLLVLTRKPSLEVAPTTLATPSAYREFSASCYLFTVSNSGVLFSHNTSTIVFPTSLSIYNQSTASVAEKSHFSSREGELRPMTLTFEHDLDRAKINHLTQYLGQRSFWSKITVRTRTDSATDCSTWTTKACETQANIDGRRPTLSARASSTRCCAAAV